MRLELTRLVLIQTSLLWLYKSCSDVNKAHLHDKSREVCIKTRSTLASLPSTGQVAEQTTVKWSIEMIAGATESLRGPDTIYLFQNDTFLTLYPDPK